MKYSKRKGIYSNSTGSLTFNPNTLEAYSYRWWRFVAVVDGLVIFNDYRYSVSTSKHQRTVRRELDAMGIKIDLFLPMPTGIGSGSIEDLILEAEECLCNQIIRQELKRQEANERARQRRITRKQAQCDAPSIAAQAPTPAFTLRLVN